MTGPIAVLSGVSKVYRAGQESVRALSSVSIDIRRGDYLALTGASGSGKSTLLNIIGGIDAPSEGEVWVDGERIDRLTEQRLLQIRRRKIAFVFQEPRLMPSLTALENVLLPAAFYRGAGQVEERGLELLARVGLAKRASHLAHQLSGGEAQRVCIARALFNQPMLILADEPTGSLDHDTRRDIVGLFEVLNAEGNTIVMVTHDPELAGRAKRRISIRDGVIHADSGAVQPN